MRKTSLLLAALSVPLVIGTTAGVLQAGSENDITEESGVAIDEAHFPDKEFRKIIKQYDENGDGILSGTESFFVSVLECPDKGITSLKGIEYLENLASLSCESNLLTELDVSHNPELQYLECSYNQIRKLDLSNNPKLIVLSCGGEVEFKDDYTAPIVKGKLESINLDGCEELSSIDISGNLVSDLGLSDSANIDELRVSFNPIKKLDLSNMKGLTRLHCNYTDISKLDVSEKTKLIELGCAGNNLSGLDVTHNPLLTYLDCASNKISSIDLSKNAVLSYLRVDDNQLTTLDLSNQLHLIVCLTDHNNLKSLDIGYTLLADAYDPYLLQDMETYYEFYIHAEGIDNYDFYWLTFDKNTKLQYKKNEGKIICKIDKNSFPDDEFRKFVTQFDSNKDGAFNKTELGLVSQMSLFDLPIHSIEGIRYFYNLQDFGAHGTQVEEFDLSNMTQLLRVDIDDLYSEPTVRSINVKGCTDLASFCCECDKIQELNLSTNINLKQLVCNGKIESLDLSNNKLLERLVISNDKLTTLIGNDWSHLWDLEIFCKQLQSFNLSNYPEVTYISISADLETLDLSHCPKLNELTVVSSRLKSLDTGKNNRLTRLQVTSSQISSFDLSHNQELEAFTCSGENIQKVTIAKDAEIRMLCVSGCPMLKQLDISSCSKLMELYCSNCGLTKLDISHNPNLKWLECLENPLTAISDFGNNPLLECLVLSDCKMSTVDLSKNTMLRTLTLRRMDLTSLDLSKNIELISIDLSDNLLTELDLSKVYVLYYVDLRMNMFQEKPKYVFGDGGEEYFEPQKYSVKSFETFVERLYTVALNRNSDPEGKAFWIKQVVEEGKTGADCARFFLLDAPEFMNRNLSVEDFVETLYKTFFDRESDAAGKVGWVTAIKNGQKTRTDVVNDFIESTEWCNVCASYGVKSGAKYHKATKASQNAIDFATRLYTCCLGRNAEESGLKYWSLALTNLEQTGAAAAKHFFESEEFVGSNTSDEVYIYRLYTTFMDRDPSGEESQYWIGELAAGRQTRQSVLAFFAQSDEFTKICKQYGIERGTI